MNGKLLEGDCVWQQFRLTCLVDMNAHSRGGYILPKNKGWCRTVYA